MNRGLYNYHDYEEMYYHQRWMDCKKIGLYLLAKIPSKTSADLIKKLEKFEYN